MPSDRLLDVPNCCRRATLICRKTVCSLHHHCRQLSMPRHHRPKHPKSSVPEAYVRTAILLCISSVSANNRLDDANTSVAGQGFNASTGHSTGSHHSNSNRRSSKSTKDQATSRGRYHTRWQEVARNQSRQTTAPHKGQVASALLPASDSRPPTHLATY
jgi:hypothetical protein